MKNRMTIRMGAAHYDAFVRGADGQPVHFNLRTMDKHQRRKFTIETVKAFREAQQ